MNRLLKFTLVFLCISCSEQDLGHNYFYLTEDEAMDIGYPYGSMIYKAKAKYHYDKILIFADIKKVHQTNNFIIVKQSPNMSLYKKYLNDNGKSNETIPNSFQKSANYYIINKDLDKVSSPMNIESLKKECQKNNIDISFTIVEKW